jgi:SAM-dependent methyltransferase
MGLGRRLRRPRLAATVRRAYEEVLGRPADPAGLAAQIAALEEGMTEADLRYALASSAEGLARRGLRVMGRPDLPDLTRERPDRYRLGVDLHDRPILTFDVEDPADYDWLERRIHETGYYDGDGVWSLEIDLDKRLLAELLAALHPRRLLELGCSSGAVLHELVERGVDAVGIDVSTHARDAAHPSVRDRILLGDLLAFQVAHDFDAIVGLDVFEHLNPNRIDDYLTCLADHLRPGGWCVANVPVYGTDPVFGNVFLDFLAEAEPTLLIPRLQVDDRGYPLHGHLVWATWDWWVERFAAAGLTRRPAVEQAAHARYDAHWSTATPARQSLFVFRKGGDDVEEAAAIQALAGPSPLLTEHAPPRP